MRYLACEHFGERGVNNVIKCFAYRNLGNDPVCFAGGVVRDVDTDIRVNAFTEHQDARRVHPAPSCRRKGVVNKI